MQRKQVTLQMDSTPPLPIRGSATEIVEHSDIALQSLQQDHKQLQEEHAAVRFMLQAGCMRRHTKEGRHARTVQSCQGCTPMIMSPRRKLRFACLHRAGPGPHCAPRASCQGTMDVHGSRTHGVHALLSGTLLSLVMRGMLTLCSVCSHLSLRTCLHSLQSLRMQMQNARLLQKTVHTDTRPLLHSLRRRYRSSSASNACMSEPLVLADRQTECLQVVKLAAQFKQADTLAEQQSDRKRFIFWAEQQVAPFVPML